MLKLKTDVLRAFGRTDIDGVFAGGVQTIVYHALGGVYGLTRAAKTAIV
jgi:hypothetical protein